MTDALAERVKTDWKLAAGIVFRAAQLRELGPGTNFGVGRLSEIHRHIYQGVLKTAGAFSDNADLRGLERVGQVLSKEFPTNITGHRETFGATMGAVCEQLLQARPFEEGGAFAVREYLSAAARSKGYVIDYAAAGVPGAWREAEAQSMRGEKAMLVDLFKQAATPSRAYAFDKFEKDRAVELFPELNASFSALDTVKATVSKYPAAVQEKTLLAARKQIAGSLLSGQVVRGQELQKSNMRQAQKPKL